MIKKRLIPVLCLAALLAFAGTVLSQPSAPTGFELVSAEDGAISLIWNENPEPDITGYMLYYDTDELGPPYDGVGAFEGESPISVGDELEFILTGLDMNFVYYLNLKALNEAEQESEYAGEVVAEFDPQLSFEMIPHDPPIIIPACGNYFRYDATVTNNTDETIEYDAWCNFVAPNGWAPDYPLKLFLDCSLEGNESVTVSPWQCVPHCEHGWFGIYTYIGKIGIYPDDVWESDYIEVEVLPEEGENHQDNNDLTGWASGWELIGWDFGNNGEFVSSTPVPDRFGIENVFPNPFNPVANISVMLPLSLDLKVDVYNIMGRKVAVLADGRFAEGYHSFVFDGYGLSSGIYFIQATVPGQMSEIRKVMLMK